MAEATLRHGEPLFIDYTPASGNISAGQVVLLGNLTGLTCGIAHLDITNNTAGSLAAGGGIYDVTMIGNYTQGTKVYWDDSNNKVTTTSTNNSPFGSIASAGGTGANTTVEALHTPWN